MTHLNDKDLKFIAVAKRAHEHPRSWWWSALPVGLVAFMLVGLSYMLSWHFSRRGIEFVICTFYQGKYSPTEIQLGKIFALFFCTHAFLSTFIFMYAYLAWKIQRRSFEVIQKIAGNDVA